MVAAARVAIHRGDVLQAREYVAKIHRLRPMLNHGLPWLSVQTGLELARVHLALGEASVAGAVLSEAQEILRVRPRLGTLVEQARELRHRVAATSSPSGQWALSLTAAELRLLPLLTSHLGFPQIGERLFLSRTTIKTQAISIYRKFGVSSRAEAIERAVQLGLLEDVLYPARARSPRDDDCCRALQRPATLAARPERQPPRTVGDARISPKSGGAVRGFRRHD
jgi:LuxR family maltose regulon positive regulatory protein